MQEVSKPKGLAKIWREIKRPFRVSAKQLFSNYLNTISSYLNTFHNTICIICGKESALHLDPRFFSKTRVFTSSGSTKEYQARGEYLAGLIEQKHVLDVGCTDFPITFEILKHDCFLHKKLRAKAASIVGIDYSREGVDIMLQNGYSDIYFMDAENITLHEKFDSIICGDVIEHLSNPGMFLRSVPFLLRPSGQLIICVPNSFSLRHALSMWFHNKEIVNHDHCFNFSPKTLATLCARHNLLPVSLKYICGVRKNWWNPWRYICAMFPSAHFQFVMIFQRKEEIDNTHFYEI